MFASPYSLIRLIFPGRVALVLFSTAVFTSLSVLAQQSGSEAGKTRPVRSTPALAHTAPALFISDIHFDPFHDPGKLKELAAAPVSQWEAILAAAPSPDQQQAFDALQKKCHARGVDTPFVLLQSVLTAMKAQQRNAKFIMVSGDLIAHAFTCRYSATVPGASPDDYQAFVLKTLSFIMGELRGAFPGVPVYAALGNNDTGCDDYHLDPGSDFLSKAGGIIAAGLPQDNRQAVSREFAAGGYYSVPMAAPMQNTRLVVVNDLFLSPQYRTCAGKTDAAGADAEMRWLQQQLQQAREAGQRVWVMGHIPPGIDPYSTIAKFRDVCGGQDPILFLSSNTMADLLVEYADVVRLAVFAHTHMDEVRLLEPPSRGTNGSAEHLVAVKMIPSISPVDGNNPSFTVARVMPSAARLKDYAVIVASNQTGVETRWTREYDYAQTYHESEFSPTAVKRLTDKFQRDNGANLPESVAYLRNYFVGDRAAALIPFWPQYVCGLNNYTGKGYASCLCTTTK